MGAGTTHQRFLGKSYSMNTETRIVLSIIAALCFISLVDCGGGDDGNSATATPTVTATVSGLEPDTQYYFAVSAFNGLNGSCSNEVSTVTPPSGVVSLKWNSVQDPAVSTYDVHYGKQSPGQPGNCAYSDSMQVAAQS